MACRQGCAERQERKSFCAFAPLKLRRTLLRPYGLRVAAPRVAREGEAWWAHQDSNLGPAD
jgi:hypothetical protein